MKYIFVHGGPGLNSHPERNLMKLPHVEDSMVFWNEPSALRDETFIADRAYENWLSSLARFIVLHSREEKVTILAHSFAAFAVNDLLPVIQDRIEKLVLIAPVFNLSTLDKNILDLAIKKKALKGDYEGVVVLDKAKTHMSSAFDETRFGALLSALSEEGVLSSYWHQEKSASIYNVFFQEEGFGLDLNSFKLVRESILDVQSSQIFDGKVLIAYGAHDPVAKLEQDFFLIQKLYPAAQITMAQNSGHYPHMEEADQFLDWLRKESAFLKSFESAQ